jgi:hypothetical protein
VQFLERKPSQDNNIQGNTNTGFNPKPGENWQEVDISSDDLPF